MHCAVDNATHSQTADNTLQSHLPVSECSALHQCGHGLHDRVGARASPHCDNFYSNDDYDPPLPVTVAFALSMAAEDYNHHLH